MEHHKEADMARLSNIREELEKLKTEILAKHSAPAETGASGAKDDAAATGFAATVENQIGELNKLVKATLEDAETTVAEHPVATVAGAMALGIVIGRVSAR
jgi:ElaB/YqjD/DUF883 family membrane-anchored ribosome-binding protein